MEKFREIERSIIKKFRKEIWCRFIKAVNDYELISENDKIMVCISGGKDSFLLAKCIQELQRHGKVHFEAFYVVMDPGYSDKHKNLIKLRANELQVPIEIFETDIFPVVTSVVSKSPCYLCARMRRGHLYNRAQELGCNKIALGHHFDDVVETSLLSMFYGAEIKTMMPKLHSDNFEGLELIRPLYLVRESDILAWRDFNGLSFLNCACKFTEENADAIDNNSKRLEMKKLLKELEAINSEAAYNLFRAFSNVNMHCILGFSKNGEKHNFLEDYDL